MQLTLPRLIIKRKGDHGKGGGGTLTSVLLVDPSRMATIIPMYTSLFKLNMNVIGFNIKYFNATN